MATKVKTLTASKPIAPVLSKMKLRGGGAGSAGTKGSKKVTPPQKVESPDELVGWKRRLYDTINRRNTNIRRVSIAAGLNPSTIRNCLWTSRSLGSDALMAVAKALDVNIHWLLTGDGEPDTSEIALSGVRVPVIAWGDVSDFLSSKTERVEAMRFELAEPVEGKRRFRLDFSGRSMSGLIEDGDTLDCSGDMRPEPEDVVVAWSATQKAFLVRKVQPERFGQSGEILAARLIAANSAWPDVLINTESGDKILAVVFDVIRHMRRSRR
jgi:lambda repressor-like predicted transcriptional regulator